MHKKEIFLEIDANLHQPIQSMEADSNSRAIRFYLTSNYAPLNLKDKKVIFKAVKPDSTDIVNDCEIIDVEKGIVETKVTKQLNAVPGRVNCQLSIIGANDYVLKTKKFVILVDSKLTESGIISSREYKTLENALSEVHGINKNFEQVNAKIDEVATKGTTVEVIEEVTKEEIERQIADGTIAHLMIEDGSVTPEKTSFYDEIATQKNLLKNAEFDYMGNNQNTVKKAIDSSIDWVLGEVNTAHHEGQHITATDTIEGHAKSAILKGNTLVNLLNTLKQINTNNYEYSFSYKIKEITIIITNNTANKYPRLSIYNDNGEWNRNVDLIYTNNKLHYTANDGEYISGLIFTTYGQSSSSYDYTSVNEFLTQRIMVLGGDYTNVDIPYFEGMQSVKMPVLKSSGKNLIDIYDLNFSFHGVTATVAKGVIQIKGTSTVSGGRTAYKGYKIKMTKGCEYTLSLHNLIENKKRIGGFYITNEKTGGVIFGFSALDNVTQATYTAQEDLDGFLWFNTVEGDTYDSTFMVQVEENNKASEYEPYKSNILTVNEDVTLRGIGEVKDELNCLTGEVTERIGEIVLNGSEDWKIYTFHVPDNYSSFVATIPTLNNFYDNGTSFISGDFATCSWNYYVSNKESEVVWNHDPNKIGIRVKSEKASTVEEIKAFLSTNNIRINYKLATPVVKTVDSSDNHVYSYKDVTHYDCSSAEGSLVPTLSIDVPTNLPAVVTRQRATIQELEKENVALKNEIEETANSSVNGDLELMSSQFELDFRLFEIEMNLDMPMMAMMRGVKSMAMTVYQQAKTLILAGKYEREDMEYKLNRYKAAGRITVEEYDELIALMDARELVD